MQSEELSNEISKLTSERDRVQAEVDALYEQLNQQKNTVAISVLTQGLEVVGDRHIDQLNGLLNTDQTDEIRAQRAFANVSREDRNLLWYANKRKKKELLQKESDARVARALELRAFNRDAVQSEIAAKLRKLENIPHMTAEDRSKWLAKGRRRKIYSEDDIPDTLRGEERIKWLEHKNKKQRLYDNADSAYDTYVERQRQLDKQFSDGNKYKYDFTYKYSFTY